MLSNEELDWLRKLGVGGLMPPDRLQTLIGQAREAIWLKARLEGEITRFCAFMGWASKTMGYISDDECMADFLRSEGLPEEEVQKCCGPVSCPGQKRDCEPHSVDQAYKSGYEAGYEAGADAGCWSAHP